MKKWQLKKIQDKKAQQEYLNEHPYCEVCGKRAYQVHEIIYRSQGGQCVPDNMISLCMEDHLRAHFRMRPYLRKEKLLKLKGGKDEPRASG